MEEIWKDVQGFEGRYQVSNHGRVKYPDQWCIRTYSSGKTINKIVRHSGIKAQCLSNKCFYYVVLLRQDSKLTINTDELVARHFCNYKEGMIIIHKDGDILNNHADNLICEWERPIHGEIWKPIKRFEGLYEISNMGRVRSLERTYKRDYKYQQDVDVPINRKYLYLNKLKRGYVHVILHKEKKRYEYSLHRLVALHFCDGYKPGLVVNHKDENPENCKASNLEWCTSQYNQSYGTARERTAKANWKRVAQYDKNGNLLAIYKSGKEASEMTGFPRPSISDWCRGAHPCRAGYIWKFI